VLFEPLQHSDVRETECAASFEGDPDLGPDGRGRLGKCAPGKEDKNRETSYRRRDRKLATVSHAPSDNEGFPGPIQIFSAGGLEAASDQHCSPRVSSKNRSRLSLMSAPLARLASRNVTSRLAALARRKRFDRNQWDPRNDRKYAVFPHDALRMRPCWHRLKDFQLQKAVVAAFPGRP
jgi:hypothetical protein